MSALHTGPGAQPTTVAHVTLDFFDRYLKNDRGALERLRQDASQPGVATLQEQSAVTGRMTGGDDDRGP